MDLPFVRITSWTIQAELRQLKDEGRASDALVNDGYALIGEDFEDPRIESEAELWLLQAHGQPQTQTHGWVEPDHWEEAYRESEGVAPRPVSYGESEMRSRLAGAWLGRAAGCLLGRPFEGLSREDAWPLLKESGLWPLTRLPSLSDLEPVRVDRLRRIQPYALEGLIGQPRIMEDDPSMDYPLLALIILERHGSAFTASDMARLWLEQVPLLRWSEAERTACRNILNGFDPPDSARHFNPCREWSGAMKRADLYGWANPGDPAAAACLAAKDASISHVKNGLYASMWAAAMNAAAFTAGSIAEIIEAGCSVLPKKSRLYEALSSVRKQNESGLSHEEFLEGLHGDWNDKLDHESCHAISNSMAVLAALLWGKGDYRLSVGLAAQSLFRSGSNAATVGGILGAWRGEDALPNDFIMPLGGRPKTGLCCQGLLEYSELVERSLRLIQGTGRERSSEAAGGL